MLLMIGSFLLAVIFVVINGATQLFYAQSLGYKLKPTGLAYFVGAIGNLISGSVVPISGQAMRRRGVSHQFRRTSVSRHLRKRSSR